MTRNTLRLLVAVGFLTNTAATGSANDIENFIKALRGSARHSHPAVHPVGHEHQGHGGYADGHESPRGLTSRDIHKQHQLAAERYRSLDVYGPSRGDRFDLREGLDPRFGRGDRPVVGSYRPGTHLTFRVGSSGYSGYEEPLVIPPAPAYPQPVYPQHAVPALPPVNVAPEPLLVHPAFEIGQIVDCPVPLAQCVKIEDPENIAPHAVHRVVAVRDPNLPPGVAPCIHSIVFVEVCVPPCPLRSLTVSRCKSRIKLDYGDYEVEIKSRNGVICIDYDN